MAVTKTYGFNGNSRVKVQVEDLLGKNPGGGWVYQAPGVGNKNAEGAHYFYKSQTAQGSLKKAGSAGHFTFKLNVAEAGKYSILLRGARDTNNPGDARNDIWIRVDGNTQKAMPKGTPTLTSGGNGFVKFKGATTKWTDAHQFSTSTHGDKNPASTVVFDKGSHTITFAPRSTGFHIDSVQVIKVGSNTNATSATMAVAAAELTEKTTTTKALTVEKLVATTKAATATEAKAEANTKVETKAEVAFDKVEKTGVVSAEIATASDDFESNKAAASKDLEFGRDGAGEQSVGLRFHGIELDKDAEVKSAYFVFTAAETSKGAAHYEIEIEDTTSAATYSKANGPDARAYLADDVDWNPGAWKAGETYKSADISALIQEVIDEGGIDALDALAFRISGSGERVAEAFEAHGTAPELVIEYA
jgi:hypothetical protein